MNTDERRCAPDGAFVHAKRLVAQAGYLALRAAVYELAMVLY